MMDTSSDDYSSSSAAQPFQLPPHIQSGGFGGGGFSALSQSQSSPFGRARSVSSFVTRKRFVDFGGVSPREEEEAVSPRSQKTPRTFETQANEVALWDFPKPEPPAPAPRARASTTFDGAGMTPRFKVNPKYQQSYLRASDFTGRVTQKVQDDYEKPGVAKASMCPCCVDKEIERRDSCMRD